MRLDHHGREVGVLGIVFQHLGLGLGCGFPGNTVSAVNFLGDQVHAVAQLHLQRIQEFEVIFFFASFNDGIGEFQGAFTAQLPVLGLGATSTGRLGDLAYDGALGVGVGVETVDADHWVDAGFADGVDVMHHVFATLFHPLQVLLGVLVWQGFAGHDRGAATVHLQGADGGG